MAVNRRTITLQRPVVGATKDQSGLTLLVGRRGNLIETMKIHPNHTDKSYALTLIGVILGVLFAAAILWEIYLRTL